MTKIIVTVQLTQPNGNVSERTVTGSTGDNMFHDSTRDDISRVASKAIVGALMGARHE